MSGSTASRDVSDHNDRVSIEGSERCCALMVRPIPVGRQRCAVAREGPSRDVRLARVPGAVVSDEADFERWSRLTNKHRACLDPLLERKTSKEIARMIGLAKPTVDQRLTKARSILGVDTRDQAAVEYARLKKKYDRITYDPMHIPDSAEIVPSDFAEGDPSTVIHLTDMAVAARSTDGPVEGLSDPLGLIWRRDHKGLARLALMMTMLVALLLVVHASLGISETLTRLVSG